MKHIDKCREQHQWQMPTIIQQGTKMQNYSYCCCQQFTCCIATHNLIDLHYTFNLDMNDSPPIEMSFISIELTPQFVDRLCDCNCKRYNINITHIFVYDLINIEINYDYGVISLAGDFCDFLYFSMLLLLLLMVLSTFGFQSTIFHSFTSELFFPDFVPVLYSNANAQKTFV